MQAIHKVELDMFKEFIQVCEKLNLRYYCIGGTALGAVRHEGFIPWDDDIDVGMPLSDYHKFLKEGQQYLSDNLFIQCHETEPNMPWYFSKIRNTSTTFVEEYVKDYPINHGVYIDIFPLDGFPEETEKRIKMQKKYAKMHNIFCHKTFGFSYGSTLRSMYYRLHGIAYPKKNLKEKIIKLSEQYDYDNSNYVGPLFGFHGIKEIFPKEVFGKGKRMKFEDIEVLIPEQYDIYLTQMYGNYMEFPPKDKQTSPHAYFVDLEKSYLDYKKGDTYSWPK